MNKAIVFCLMAVALLGFVYSALTEGDSHAARVGREGQRPTMHTGGGSKFLNRSENAPQANYSDFEMAWEREIKHKYDWTGEIPEEIERAKQRAAVFFKSRKTNDRSTWQTLRQALNDGIISEKEYYGELAHMLGPDYEDPLSLIKEIVESKNPYGIEVMFATIRDAHWVMQLKQQDKAEIFALLQEIRPKMHNDVSLLGISTISRYENWLASSARFNTTPDYGEYLEDLVMHKAEDPREYFAMLDAGVYQKLIAFGKWTAAAHIKKVVEDYHRSYPENSVSNAVYQRHFGDLKEEFSKNNDFSQ